VASIDGSTSVREIRVAKSDGREDVMTRPAFEEQSRNIPVDFVRLGEKRHPSEDAQLVDVVFHLHVRSSVEQRYDNLPVSCARVRPSTTATWHVLQCHMADVRE
jgi:hypothetical protein